MNNLSTCSTWHTIDTAPKDRPILTNLGLAMNKSPSVHNNHPLVKTYPEVLGGWHLCDSTGYIPYDEYGSTEMFMLLDMPRIWTEFNPPEIV